MRIFDNLRRHDLAIIFTGILLAIFGLVTVFTTTFFPERNISSEFTAQALFVVLGVVAYGMISVMDVRLMRLPHVAIALYILGFALLTIVLTIPQNNVRRWIDIGPINVQPSEVAKICIVLFNAWLLSSNWRWRFVAALGAGCVYIFLIWRQPALGNSLILLGIVLIQVVTCLPSPLAIWKTLRPKARIIATVTLISLPLAIFALGPVVWEHVLSDYQKDRINAFVNPKTDLLGSEWQTNQSLIAIVSGQVFGKGILQGTQVNYGLLPYAHTDFAYAAIAEQFGVVGMLAILGCLYMLCMRINHISTASDDKFARILAIGIMASICLNTIVHVGMNLKLMPVTGVPLPLISYGGSATLMTFVAISLLQTVIASLSNDKATFLVSKYK